MGSQRKRTPEQRLLQAEEEAAAAVSPMAVSPEGLEEEEEAARHRDEQHGARGTLRRRVAAPTVEEWGGSLGDVLSRRESRGATQHAETMPQRLPRDGVRRNHHSEAVGAQNIDLDDYEALMALHMRENATTTEQSSKGVAPWRARGTPSAVSHRSRGACCRASSRSRAR